MLLFLLLIGITFPLSQSPLPSLVFLRVLPQLLKDFLAKVAIFALVYRVVGTMIFYAQENQGYFHYEKILVQLGIISMAVLCKRRYSHLAKEGPNSILGCS